MRDGISISDMAKLHGLTRQTLIYYDSIDLFKPDRVDDNGYRMYSWRQIPHLREICFLRSLGIELKEIAEHFENRNPEQELEFLRNRKQSIEQEIARLQKARENINFRMQRYQEAIDGNAMHMLDHPFVQYLEPRKAIFQEYYKPINKENLHRTVMQLWKLQSETGSTTTGQFGTIVRKNDVQQGNLLEHAGSCVFLPMWERNVENVEQIPGGEYVCMYKYGMPYDNHHLKLLLNWLHRHNWELIGDIVDVCLLDTTFYTVDQEVDFCMLQAPVRKIEETV